jgi:hypothetical protein
MRIDIVSRGVHKFLCVCVCFYAAPLCATNFRVYNRGRTPREQHQALVSRLCRVLLYVQIFVFIIGAARPESSIKPSFL